MNKMTHLPDDWDDNPEWTEEDFARARPLAEVLGHEVAAAMMRPLGRPPMAIGSRKEKINIRLSPDVLGALRATGAGWQTRIDEALRKVFVK